MFDRRWARSLVESMMEGRINGGGRIEGCVFGGWKEGRKLEIEYRFNLIFWWKMGQRHCGWDWKREGRSAE